MSSAGPALGREGDGIEGIRTLTHPEVLKRLGTSRESASRLARKAAEAEQVLGIHGVSVTAASVTGAASIADRADVEKIFAIHDTPTRADRWHRTVELPKPITQETADQFNHLFGRK
jgi:hypothetical protein